MMKFIEATGRNEEAAILAALEQLGLDRDNVSVEILERPKIGFLGIGSSPAKVRVSYESPDEPARDRADQVATTPQESEKSGIGQAVSQSVEAFLTGLMHHMFVEAQVSIRMGGEDIYEVELVGQDLGSLIGRRGETLDAIQQLTNYAVNRGRSKRVRIHVDAENYRVKREEALVHLANKVAAKVIKYRRSVTLEPMNAYERHVIHSALQEMPEVSTYSVGAEPNRRTVVDYAKN